jgi:hypothetical protein
MLSLASSTCLSTSGHVVFGILYMSRHYVLAAREWGITAEKQKICRRKFSVTDSFVKSFVDSNLFDTLVFAAGFNDAESDD